MNKTKFKIYHFISYWLLDIRHLFKLTTILLIFVLSFIFVSTAKATTNQFFPRKANYFLKLTLNETEARELAKWDLVILDMEIQARSPELIRKMRALNPQIIILVYITPQEITQSANSAYSIMRQKLVSGIPDAWYLKTASGSRITWWPGTYMLNVTNDCPVVNGLKFNQYLSRFVSNELLSSGLWDGIFYDNAWDNVTYFVGANVDTDLNGQVNADVDVKWREGMKFIYNETRSLTGEQIIIGNGTTREYKNELNGKMLENFIAPAWASTMNTYRHNFTTALNPKINIINANTLNSGVVNLKNMRFGLASTLLEDGYFAYDYGDTNHGQTWWYDEYGVNLGAPAGQAVSQSGAKNYQADVWQRDFANGLAVVNSTAENKTIALGGEYEKIHGTQDKAINDGSIITEANIAGNDGLILLKTFSTLNDVVFKNGDFARFFNIKGERVRNGFFVFDPAYKGGDKIAKIDLDGDGARDLLVVSKNKITAWRADGQILMWLYPYTINYQGELKVAVGDLDVDGKSEIYVAPSVGYKLPIKILSREGIQIKNDWYPFGDKYNGGYSLAVGHLTGTNQNDLVIAKNTQTPLINIFDYNYKLAYQWLAFNKKDKFGSNVATGDVNGDGVDEIIIGAGAGAGPRIRIFAKDGKLISSEFTAYTTSLKQGVEVLSVDVDFDGKDDVVGMGGGI